jgi:hypothetical protein
VESLGEVAIVAVGAETADALQEIGEIMARDEGEQRRRVLEIVVAADDTRQLGPPTRGD